MLTWGISKGSSLLLVCHPLLLLTLKHPSGAKHPQVLIYLEPATRTLNISRARCTGCLSIYRNLHTIYTRWCTHRSKESRDVPGNTRVRADIGRVNPMSVPRETWSWGGRTRCTSHPARGGWLTGTTGPSWPWRRAWVLGTGATCCPPQLFIWEGGVGKGGSGREGLGRGPTHVRVELVFKLYIF